MNGDPILEEVWRIKEKLSGEMAADADAYWAKLEKMMNAEEKGGRKVIRSAAELRNHMAEIERQHNIESTLALKDQAPPRH